MVKRVYPVLLFLLLSPSVLLGQSVLQFPRVIATGNLYTGLAVGNPTTADAAVTFTAFQPDGTVLAGGARNPVTVTIPPAGQYARLFPEIFGISSFNGWVQAASVTNGLTGFFVSGNTSLSDLNGAGSVVPGVDAVLPLAVEDSVTRTEVTIVNVNPETVSVTLTLYAAGGGVLTTKNLTLPPMGLERQTLSTLFGSSDFSSASHLRVRADRPVVAHEVVADFQMPGSSLRRETAALTGQAPAAGKTLVIPQLATGGEWLSVIGLVNNTGVVQDVTISAYKEDGSLWQVGSNPKRVTLPSNGSLRTMVGDLFGFSPDTLNTGWIQVASAQGFVTAYIGYGNSLTPSFALVQAAPTEDASRYAVFSHVAEGAGFYTGLTVLNAGAEPADVEFYTLRPDGGTVGRATMTLAPNQKVARLFRELLPASLEQVGGWGFLRSSKPVIAAVLFGSSSYALANVPQQLPAGDFIPPAQTTGAITGTVRSAGAGVPGVQITLSGPVTTVRATDDSGRYVFSQLPSGQYRVSASRVGALVAPAERVVSVNRDNVDAVDFDAAGLTVANGPAITVITPVSVFAGSGSLTVRVIGSEFSPSSIVRFNDQAMPTTFVNSTELNAAVSASLLSQPATLQVTVETPPPGGGRSAAVNFTVTAVPANPLIAGRVAVGSFPAGVAVDAVRRRALVTNQSADSVTVVDLATLQAVSEIRVGRSPAEGIDIHPGKDIALVANPGGNDVSVIDLSTNAVTRTVKVGRFPIGLAVNAVTNRAYVVNGEDDTVSVINLDTFEVLGQIGVGSRPSNVAVNPQTNQAVVTNRGGNSVSVIDLSNGTILATVPVREFPRGVAVHAASNRAVVVNANGNSVSILNLANRTVEATVNVGTGPTGAALHLGTNSVIVTNSGITRSEPGVGPASSVSVINLDSREIIATIPVGSAAFGVDVDEERQIAVVADFGSNDVTVVRIPNPVPRITDIEPKTFPAGGGSFTITVRGTGFVSSSVITLNRQPLPTVFVSTTELRGTVSAAMADDLLHPRGISLDQDKPFVSQAVQPVQFDVGVENPGPGGGANPPPATPGGTTIQPQNAVPVLLSLSPRDIQINTTDLTLTLSGNNFNATSIINFGGLQFSPSSSSQTSMSVVIPRNQLAAGTVLVTVTNPPPGGGTSASLTFRVDAQSNPAPAVISVNPSSISAGSGSTTVTVTATGLIAASTGTLAGVGGSVAGNTISFALPATQLENAGTLSGLISTPGPGGGTATFSVNVLNPAPTVGSHTPANAEKGSSSVSLQVSGTNFRDNAQITLSGTPIATTFNGPTQLTGTIPASLLAQTGDLTVGVTNPAPGGGSATGGVFKVVEPIPAITSVTPAAPRPGQSIRIAGRNFRSDSVVLLRGAAISSSFVSSTELAAAIPSPIAFGSADLVVMNPAVGTGPAQSSTPFGITIANPAPTVQTVSPSSGASGTTVSITVVGTNFESGVQIIFGGAGIPTTLVNSNTLSGTVTLGSAGTISVSATNPGGFASNTVFFTVTSATPPPPPPPPPTTANPAPTIATVSPSLVAFGSPDQTVTINGNNFIASTTATFAGTAVTITTGSATSLVITVPAALLTPGGNKTIAVTNPAPGGGTANATLLANAFPFSPIQVEKLPGGTQQFVATATGTLIWSVNGIDGGNATFGTVSGTGFYTAPAAVPSPATFRLCARLSTDPTVLACSDVTIKAVPSAGQDLVVFNDYNQFDDSRIVDPNNKLMVRNLVSFTGSGSRASGTVVQFDCGRNAAFAGACTGGLPMMTAELTAAGMTISSVNSSSGSLTSIPANVKVLFLWLPTITYTPAEINTLKNFALEGGRIVFIGENSGFYGAGIPIQNDLFFKMGAIMRNVGQAINCGTVVLPGSSLRSHQVTAGMTQVTIACASVITLGPNDFALYYDTTNTQVLAGVAKIDTTPLPTAPPTITSITPNTGAAGSSVNVTIAGANFIAGSTPAFGTNVTISGGNVTVSNITVVDSNTLTATLTISLGAPLNSETATITTSNGSVTGGSFTITAPAPPQVTNISPSAGVQGTTVGVTLTGSNFPPGVSANTVNVSGTGVVATVTSVTSPTTIVANFAIAPGAALGARTVTVTTSGGTSTNVINFTVNPPAAPTVTAISPDSGFQGSTVTLTLTGTNLSSGAVVGVSGSGVTAGTTNVTSSTSLTVSLTIGATAATGMRTITVTTTGGTSPAFSGFTVNSGNDIVAGFSRSLNPNGVWSYGHRSTLSGNLTVYDTSSLGSPPALFLWSSAALGPDPGVAYNPTGSDITFNNILFPASMLHFHPGPAGQYSVIRWTAPAAGVYSIQGIFKGLNSSPTSTDVHVLVNSTSLFDANINNFNVPTPFSLLQSLAVGDIVEFSVGFGTNGNYFSDSTGVSGTITPVTTVPAPTLASLSPNSGAPGSSVDVTLSGANFVGGATSVNISGTGVTLTNAGLVGEFSAEGTAADALAIHNGTLNGTVGFTTGKTGSAFSLNGNGFVDLGAWSPGTKWTVEAWVNPAAMQPTDTFSQAPSPTRHGIVGSMANCGDWGLVLWDTRANNTAPSIMEFGTAMVPTTGCSSDPVVVRSTQTILSGVTATAGTWYHVLGTNDGTTAKIYVNGVLKGSGAVQPNYSGTTSGTHIGHEVCCGDSFAGLVDEVKIYDRALSASEVWNAFSSFLNVVSPTTATARFTVDANAAAGARNVTVTTPGGGSNSVIFTVNSQSPTLASISPSSGSVGTAVPVTLTGTNFVSGATIGITGSGVTVGTVTVVNSTTITTTLTIASGASLGSRDITVATTGGASGIVQFLVTATFTGSVFTGVISTNWSDASNWSTGVVPDSTTSVLIPSAAVRQPVLTTNVSVLNLTVETGAALSTAGFTITVLGSVDAGNTITGTGTVLMSGTGTVQGSLPNLTVSGMVSFPVSTTSTVTGNLTIQGSGVLDIVGTVTVTADLSVINNAVLKMVSASGVVTINGNTSFNNNALATPMMTAGTLNLKGNLSITGGSTTNFVGSGTHQTVLNGTAPQTLDMAFPGATQQRFQNLRMSNTAGVIIGTSGAGIQVNGNLDITVAGALSGGSLTVMGTLTTSVGSSITLAAVTLHGAVGVAGTFSPGTATFAGTAQNIPAGLSYQNVVVTGTASFSGTPATITGDLTLTGGTLNVSGTTLTVTGNFLATGSGGLQMLNISTTVTINGSASFHGSGDTTGFLTGGTLNIKGNFSSNNSGFQNFVGSGVHQTVLNGTAAQTVSMSFPGAANQRFNNLQIANSAGVVFSTPVQIGGNLTITVAAALSGPGSFTLLGSLATSAGSSVTLAAVTLQGTMSVSGTFTPATVTFAGGAQTIQAGLGYQNVVVTGSASFVTATTTTFTGSLTISGGTLDVTGATLTVAGNLTATGSGGLKMLNASTIVTINGAANFNGSGDTTGFLTAGTLNLKGNFSSNNSGSQNFVGSGTHLTLLNGVVAQTLSMAFPGPTNQRFQNLTLANAAGVVFSGAVQVDGNVTISSGNATGAGPVTIAGNLTDTAGGRWQVGATTMTGSPTGLPTAMTTNLTFTGAPTLPAAFLLTGNLTVSGAGAILDMKNKLVTVTGNFTTQSNGIFKMQTCSCGSFLLVLGDATFDGGSTDTFLEEGAIDVKGNFKATNASGVTTSFAPTNLFLVTLSGTSQQTVQMTNPGLTQQRFRMLEIRNTIGVSMLSDLFVGEQLISTTLLVQEKIIGNGRTLTALSTAVEGLDLDNVNLVLNLASRSILFNDVAFRNYPDPSTRITITSNAANHSMSRINFVQGAPTAGFLVNASGPMILFIDTIPFIPSNVASPRTVVGSGAQVFWFQSTSLTGSQAGLNVVGAFGGSASATVGSGVEFDPAPGDGRFSVDVEGDSIRMFNNTPSTTVLFSGPTSYTITLDSRYTVANAVPTITGVSGFTVSNITFSGSTVTFTVTGSVWPGGSSVLLRMILNDNS